ncbi:hypothetical protein KIH39_16160 [Telmatocola sphagniphila]|uniref:Cytochrome c n=1 Tax=Telmatocola sphagniphila TaxID=1123043 RepID=A0A8E6EWA6_9BACT|nr:hypothetical protein [Telmatocola sphagniphila]QVL30383.1 hypothetical protein KIH39_16160 [Telmatocola sphagniphila]
MKQIIASLLAVALAAVGPVVAFGHYQTSQNEKKQKAEEKKKVKELMSRKLELSHKLLTAMILNDTQSAVKSAKDLLEVSKDPAWQSLIPKDRLEEYQIWSDSFRKNIRKIGESAKENNLDGAKMGYLEMTHTCFNCHTYIRDFVITRLDKNDSAKTNLFANR